ncbi:MAG: PilZ domain-containing protein [Deltaproteobacteria bacterium]|jgi:hypothetical protein|nr:PilZ domain-containing protein [Deltaproteobacteria bacterium]
MTQYGKPGYLSQTREAGREAAPNSGADHELADGSSGADKRAYSRVPVYFRASYRRLNSPDEPQICPRQRGMDDGRPSILSGPGLSAELARFLANLDAKLDSVLGLLQKDSLNEFFPERLMVTELSAAGVLVQSDALKAGDFIELVMSLGESPPCIASGIGQVIRQGPVRFGVPTLAVCFLNMRDSDREQIVRYVFKEERERIRAERLK